MLVAVLLLTGLSPSAADISILRESLREVAACPGTFARCMLSSPCRATMACAGHCVHADSKQMNLTCFVPCTYPEDQTLFNAFTDCVMRAKPDPDDPGVDDLPGRGQCLDVSGAMVGSFDVASMEGPWFVVAGASSLEAYDCQANKVTRRNATHWQIDEYYQGYIEGVGFKWAQSRQMIHALPDPAAGGRMAWRPADGASGYEAVYHVLASTDDYKIFYYCAPLRPTPLFWSSFILYSRRPSPPPKKALWQMEDLLKRFQWDTPLSLVNHEGCTYRIADPDSGQGESSAAASPSSSSSSYLSYLSDSLASCLSYLLPSSWFGGGGSSNNPAATTPSSFVVVAEAPGAGGIASAEGEGGAQGHAHQSGKQLPSTVPFASLLARWFGRGGVHGVKEEEEEVKEL